jgi:hypothetical protein
MRKIVLFFSLVFLLIIPVCSFADVVATVTDKDSVKVELTELKTKSISFVTTGHLLLEIFPSVLSSIQLDKDGETLVLKSKMGSEIRGTSDSELKGSWELGDYSISLSNIKSAEFKIADTTEELVQPDGFVAIATDETGKTMGLSGFSYRWGYYYYSPYINGNSHDNYYKVPYLPARWKQAVVGVPFTDIDTIKFTDPKTGNSKLWLPTVTIKLLNSNTLTGELYRLGANTTYDHMLCGQVQSGNLIEKISQITFDHKRDKKAERKDMTIDCISLDSLPKSRYTVSIKNWQGDQVVFSNGLCFDGLYEGHGWDSYGMSLKLKVGQSVNDVGFDKIKSIQFEKQGQPEAKLATASGQTINISFPKMPYIGGKVVELDAVGWIKMENVSSLEIKETSQKQ